MIWDVLNNVLQAGTSAISSLLTVLPASPLFLSSSDIAAVSVPAGYVAFWLPVPAMIATFTLYILAVLGWVGALLIKQLIEAAIP